MIYDIIIIGAGPAGIYGTFYATYCGLKVLLVEIDHFIGGKPIKFYPVKPIHDFPGLIDITGQELTEKLINQLETMKSKNLYEIKTDVDIVGIEKSNELFTLTDQRNEKYKSKYVILATGYTSFKYHTIEEQKVFTKKDFHHFIDDFKKFQDKNVVVLGGGDSAFDQTYLLRDIAKQITLIHRSEKYRAHHDIVEKVKNCKNVNIISNHIVEKVEDNKITIVDTINNDSQIVNYDELLICWGVELMPNNLSRTNILNKMYKLEVNEKLESININNLYGVGNVNDRKDKDLIINVQAQMIKVILDILAKEKISIPY